MPIIGNLTRCQLELDTDADGKPHAGGTASIRWCLRLEGLTNANVGHPSAVNYVPTLDLAGRVAYASGSSRTSILAQIKIAALDELTTKKIVGVDLIDVYAPDFSIGL